MKHHTPYPSLASAGARVPAIAAKHIEHTFRHLLRGPRVVNDPRFLRLITGEPHPFGNVAVVSCPTDPAAAAAAIGPLSHCGAPAVALFDAPPSAPVRDTLNAYGFEPHGALVGMVVEIDALARTALPPGYSFARVGLGLESDEWADAFSTGYELPRAVGTVFAPNATGASPTADAPTQFFAIRKAGRMVCTSLAALNHGVAGIYAVATIPDERGRGLAAHVTAEALRQVRPLGYRVGVLQSTSAGHSVYLKLGFTDVSEVPLYIRMPK